MNRSGQPLSVATIPCTGRTGISPIVICTWYSLSHATRPHWVTSRSHEEAEFDLSPCAGCSYDSRQLADRRVAWHCWSMKLTAIFEPTEEGGYTCFVEEVPAAISQGETLEEAKANLLDALRLVLDCQRELAEKDLSPNALREPID